MGTIQAINANPETVEAFLQNSYVVPDYQRPYCWEEDHCVKLWEDLTGYFEKNDQKKPEESTDPYFLGNVVVYKER